ncbi:Mucin-associated surface protein (MASP) [Trypanosoma cruzi]|uniref:Mucin-associated surface protein (MASP), putative n=2 Tax=Trypanosoma cruzi TaxID=5693 RepID=Q4CS60_TRYCC|nr:mucin-associated surface protein (MASP), putative [Trypanosoma cruzi]EAN83114.1 mucin-associated surface protein (MASP), putative [Trypanosoma cruzi]PWU89244.1 Mucin-associated surface protein (MASP) [Trypanosoma cruzi]|eukprot:XP_804965.1 mucin-associated surface protein (MASP) [Trypanosoma cruzi strain CL Brener]
MAMMVPGRVLLVCALCVLWCGLTGVSADGAAGGHVTLGENVLEIVGGQSTSSLAIPGAKGASTGGVLVGGEHPTSDSGTPGDVSFLPGSDDGSVSDSSEEDSALTKDSPRELKGKAQSVSLVVSPPKVKEIVSPESNKQGIVLPAPAESENHNAGGVGAISNREIRDNGGHANASSNDSDPVLPSLSPKVQLPAISQAPGIPPPPSLGQQTSTVTILQEVETPAARSRETSVSSKEISRHAEDPAEGKKGIPPAPTHSQNSTDEKHKTSLLQIGTESAAPKPLSPDGVLEQNSEGTATKDAMKTDVDTGSPAATSESSISTSEIVAVQNKTDEKDGNEQQPEPKGLHNDPDAGNTNFAPTAGGTAAETVKTITAQNNATSNSVDSDGSTAVSHTTFPLLLLLVACAAAAAVVAA